MQFNRTKNQGIHQNIKLIRGIATMLLIAFASSLQAQDFAYSQFYHSAFLYNPALTGHIPSSYRLAVVHRQQWTKIDGGYKTSSFTADLNRFSTSLNTIGFGFAAYSDQSMNGNFIQNSVLASMAYHLGIDEAKRFYLSIGIQGGLLASRFKTDDLNFASGLLGGTNEIIAAPSSQGMDMRLGLNWTSYLSNRFSFKLGAAYLHIGGISENIIQGGELPATIVYHGEADWYITEKLLLQPSFMVLSQGGARNVNFGTLAYKGFNDNEIQMFAGVHWRVGDAIIPVIGGERNSIRLAISYDFTVSPLMAANGFAGGIEISFSYTGQVARTRHETDIYQSDYFHYED